MADTYQWRTRNFAFPDMDQGWNPYNATAFLNDFALNDHTTKVLFDTKGPPPAIEVQALITFDGTKFVKGATASYYNFDNDLGGGAPTVYYRLEALISSVWTVIATGTPALRVQEDNAWTFTATATALRFTIGSNRPDGNYDVQVAVSDFRYTVTTCNPPSGSTLTLVDSGTDPGGATAFVDLSWTTPSTGDLPISYEIFRILNAPEVGEVFIPPIQTGNSMHIMGLPVGEQLCFHLITQNDCGKGPLSNTVCTQVDPVVNPPGNFHGTEVCEGGIVSLFWEAPVQPPVVEGFIIRRNGEQVALLGPLATEWVDTDPLFGVSAVYVLTAYNVAGESPPATLTIIACEWNSCVDEPEVGVWAVLT